MNKKSELVETMYRRKILEILKDVCPEGINAEDVNNSNNADKGVLRSKIRDTIKSDGLDDDGRTHIPCNKMLDEGLLVQVKLSYRVGYRMYITPKGVGYLESMTEYEVGMPAA
ncbi:hypothetical protein MettiDRAFT_2360 [Methanolobus tindarius DSM 2278]|uniref:Uncharacterized protein n=1 Tax=Methanolobus tindarius DSM 2278 TaxID=1090322 RepID=W9DSU5_METTI|nr:hypothetical protein [Methanolobus tindarius]ETA68873.1 hypothetical protein MettiDRAFT_2360 [Methanolobus tindarius DSM 2278]